MTDSTVQPSASHDTVRALRAGFKLGGSLVLTYGVTLAVRMLLPRHLGVELFGLYNAGDAFAATFFVFITFGVDMYSRQKVTLRPEHASDFFGGVLALRVAITAVLLVAMWAVMTYVQGRPPAEQWLIFVFGLGQLALAMNNTLAAFLHAKGQVDGLSILNVVTKMLWGVGLLAVAFAHLPLPWLAASFLASEGIKYVMLYRLCQQHVGLHLRFDFKTTWTIMAVSLPFFANSAALAANGRLDVALLEQLGGQYEVGIYSGAWTVAGMTMFLSPVVGWVLLPLLSKAAARSRDELIAMIRRTIELTLTFTVPTMMAIGLGADLWIAVIPGKAFAPGVMALQILAPMFVLTYVAMVSGIALQMLDRPWTVTLTSVSGVILNGVLNLVFIVPFLKWFGPSGGATGSAVAMVTTELIITGVMLSTIGPTNAFDKRSLDLLLRTAAVCAVVIWAHRLMRDLGAIRLLVDAVLYVALALLVRALRLKEILGYVRAARSPTTA